MNSFQGTTAAVIGLARAGAPAAKFLIEIVMFAQNQFDAQIFEFERFVR